VVGSEALDSLQDLRAKNRWDIDSFASDLGAYLDFLEGGLGMTAGRNGEHGDGQQGSDIPAQKGTHSVSDNEATRCGQLCGYRIVRGKAARGK
jgi:hypothetical protein